MLISDFVNKIKYLLVKAPGTIFLLNSGFMFTMLYTMTATNHKLLLLFFFHIYSDISETFTVAMNLL